MPSDARGAGQERSRLEHLLWPGRDPQRAGAAFGNQRTALRRRAFIEQLEESGFNWQVFAVAASGFFTDSYNLFASNVILPALAFVYWNGPNHDMALAFNLATLGASAVGQLVFGVFADLFGRRALYGIELIIVIISTIGLLQCSPGFTDGDQHTWNIDVWIIFWRTVMGFGIGAEYPLSACIAAEWSSTKSRGRMMSAVFLMQPLGQLCAYGAGLTALRAFGNSKVDIDKLWRYVIGIGAVPTLLALAFRLYMPESGRYTFDVRENIARTQTDTSAALSHPSTQPNNDYDSDAPEPDIPEPNLPEPNIPESNAPTPNIPDSPWNQFDLSELWNYVYHEGHGRYLVGTSVTWLLLDFVFYGLGFNNPSTLAKLWSSQYLQYPPDAPWWLRTSDFLNATIGGEVIINGTFANDSIAEPLIHDVLGNNMTHAVYTVSIASILGSIAMIMMINHFDRKDMLTGTFVILGFVLIIVCASFKALFHQGAKHIVLIVFWIVISFLFQFGPNTLTFIIPAEVFPTRYRCSFYGIAAAWGKIGAVLVQIVILQRQSISDPNSTSIRWLLLGFAFCMFLGAVFSYTCLPHVQVPNTKTAPEVWFMLGGKSFMKRPPPLVNVPLEELPPPPRGRPKSNEQDEERLQEMEEIQNGHAH
ncbi:hypothetical protein M409DRAFT_18465 [Zasmidium cellare ATCC 36951]|uniref:Major facilitator superfamily (MFS) profile domain-containing protein n=1 Tax=Zasmidium cellare ATCC 36951 TaxID=1080233 RepID=A0A6A6CYV2_ZASCE|nr:uncharacterized protein M409DRAFT_18465 [Zasmidium cellare ATCC 36951]KAF2171348.1 hypothetical protein M409DRAFT_18465 [Zasmidium cellare ATCC 36951]